jgi:hypothetical protein
MAYGIMNTKNISKRNTPKVGGDVSPNPWVLECALNVLALMVYSPSQTFVSKNQIVMDDIP